MCKKKTHFQTDILPTKPTFDNMLDDRVFTKIPIQVRDEIKNHTDTDEVDQGIEERPVFFFFGVSDSFQYGNKPHSPVCEDDSTVVYCLLPRVVPQFAGVVRSFAHDPEFLLEVARHEWEEGYRRQQDIRDERFNHCGESCCHSIYKKSMKL